MIATGHMWPFKFKLNQSEIQFFSDISHISSTQQSSGYYIEEHRYRPCSSLHKVLLDSNALDTHIVPAISLMAFIAKEKTVVPNFAQPPTVFTLVQDSLIRFSCPVSVSLLPCGMIPQSFFLFHDK